MPSYFYHLVFELYPSLRSTQFSKSAASEAGRNWLPPRGTSIFDELPSTTQSNHTFRHWPRCGVGSNPGVSAVRLPGDSSTAAATAVIDCGTLQAPSTVRSDKRLEVVTKRQLLDRAKSFPPPPWHSALHSDAAEKDWRFGLVTVESLNFQHTANDMDGDAGQSASAGAAPGLGPTFAGPGTATKAKLMSPATTTTEMGWGVVHFYREGEETASLDESADTETLGSTQEEDLGDCTTLCIPAVPAYMSPGDFLGFVGERWRNDISHCRLVMTARMNRYLALLKFRSAEKAKEWKNARGGKAFTTMEPQVCHVVFVKSVVFKTPADALQDSTGASSTAVSATLKPFPPPTPNLVELPTCPVCLERMDETNGLMTIPCSHIFHCTCLQNWKGSGCPVCRFTNTSQGGADYDPNNPYTHPFGSSVSNLCSMCDCTDDLWICLICGYIGCGRYKGGHAKDHWKETAHSFALELETQHVWDYAGDMWVHRLIRNKGDGKVVELPGRSDANQQQENQQGDVVPRAKMDSIGLEYTHLITSQLESQRAYYEEMLNKAVDKASKASAVAESASSDAHSALEKFSQLNTDYHQLKSETIPELERDLAREKNKATKSEMLARNLSKSVQEEKRINEGLMKRIEHLDRDSQEVRKQMEGLKGENDELKEMNRDLSMFISGQEKLKELEAEEGLEDGEVEGGTVGVVEKKGRRRKKTAK